MRWPPQVDTEITYSRKDLTLRVVDTVVGFDRPYWMKARRGGTSEFTGMRERARRIRARFEVSTALGPGRRGGARSASIAYGGERRLEAQVM